MTVVTRFPVVTVVTRFPVVTVVTRFPVVTVFRLLSSGLEVLDGAFATVTLPDPAGAPAKVQKDVVSQVTGGPCCNSAGVQSAERCRESGDRWTM